MSTNTMLQFDYCRIQYIVLLKSLKVLAAVTVLSMPFTLNVMEADARSCTNASYYGQRFNGRRTASGEVFNMNAMTTAHKTLPFGTRLRVTDPNTGKSVVVRVNDRGPFVSGRGLDLSRAAFSRLFGGTSKGVGRVCYTKI